MKNATILLLLDREARCSDFPALMGSARDLDLHLSVMVLAATPEFPAYLYAGGAYGTVALPEGWVEEVEQVREQLREQVDLLRADLAKEGVSADVEALLADGSTLTSTLARRALTCDLVAVSDWLGEDVGIHGHAVRMALFFTPVGILLNGVRKREALHPERVMLAWNSGLPAARAAHAALQLLRSATEVTVAIFDPAMTPLRDGTDPGSDVARWLSHHGCTVVVQQHPSGGMEIGEAILDRSRNGQTDLVVMGAYQRSRMREAILGGTTRTMIEQNEVPVLLAH